MTNKTYIRQKIHADVRTYYESNPRFIWPSLCARGAALIMMFAAGCSLGYSISAPTISAPRSAPKHGSRAAIGMVATNTNVEQTEDTRSSLSTGIWLACSKSGGPRS